MGETIPLSELDFETIRTSRGSSIVVCFRRGYPEILGHAYGSFRGWARKTFWVQARYTHEHMRRRGVQRAITMYLFEAHRVSAIIADGATADGAAMQKALGYVYESALGAWVLRA